MKTVYFAQHGIALASDEDETRPLSDFGHSEVRKVAACLKRHGVVVSSVFHSGKLRAQQTADLFAQEWTAVKVSEQPGMAPNDEPAELIAQLDDNALYVGHLPHIQKVVSKLISGNENAATLKFKNTAVACVEIDAQSTCLRWFITPDLC